MQHNQSSVSPGRARARLTKYQAVSIFQSKSSAASAARMAVSYGVSEKAIRDIWKRRTWARETLHLDPSQSHQQKTVGRPKGSRDSKPRKTKVGTIPHNTLAFPSTWSQKKTDGLAQDTDYSKRRNIDCCIQREDLDSAEARSMQKYLVQSHVPIAGSGGHHHGDSLSFTSKSYPHPSPWASQLSSVDEQLGEWDASIWSDPQDADPFRQDWTPISCE
jgi:hypothetical protein